MTLPGLRLHRHDTAGFEVPLPTEWESLTDVRDGVPLVALEPDQGLGFRANVVVTVEPLPDGLTLQRWQDQADVIMDRAMAGYLLLDREYAALDGRATLHRVAHHADDQGNPVTTEQWATIQGNTGYTLTASAHTLAFDSVADLFTEIAGGFAPLDRAQNIPGAS